jgi:putative FmdB family regulatory protein
MPIYEYACSSCEHRFDALQKISDVALVHCPQCDEPALRKLLSAPKFRLKGQGWYETDFKTGNKRNLHGDADAKAKKPDESPKDAVPKGGDKPAATPAATKDSKATSA